MNVLCFDISSGGISAALFNSQLQSLQVAESQWDLEPDESGAATLSVPGIEKRFKETIRCLNIPAGGIEAISIGTFMHNFVLLGEADEPLTPVFTWLDRRGDDGLQYVRRLLGERFHTLTGCRYHPMFPVFKLASIGLTDSGLLKRTKRVVSLKTLLVHRLTGAWVEDHGMASASGLFNVNTGDWDSDILSIIGLNRTQLPTIVSQSEIAGSVTARASSDLGLSSGIRVVAGSGDGFFANLGSDCEVPEKIAVTLGTSAVARQALSRPVLDPDAGTFCYRSDNGAYLLGCAGSNGGNALDWGREIFAELLGEGSLDPPIFIPLLHGERSPDWNPHLTASWHGLTARHTAADLARSILEGVVFNLVHFVEIVQKASGEKIMDVVLSGNGFLHPAAAPLLAGVSGIPAWMPKAPGLASLRGAAICALRALAQPYPSLEADPVSPLVDSKIERRYVEYRRLRAQY